MHLALLRVELRSKNVSTVDRRGERLPVIAFRRDQLGGDAADVKAVDEIEQRIRRNSCEQRIVAELTHVVPSDVRHAHARVGGRQRVDLGVDPPQPGVAAELVALPRHQLSAEADAEHRLAAIHDQARERRDEPECVQIAHAVAECADAGQNQRVRPFEDSGVTRDNRRMARTFDRTRDRSKITQPEVDDADTLSGN